MSQSERDRCDPPSQPGQPGRRLFDEFRSVRQRHLLGAVDVTGIESGRVEQRRDRRSRHGSDVGGVAVDVPTNHPGIIGRPPDRRFQRRVCQTFRLGDIAGADEVSDAAVLVEGQGWDLRAKQTPTTCDLRFVSPVAPTFPEREDAFSRRGRRRTKHADENVHPGWRVIIDVVDQQRGIYRRVWNLHEGRECAGKQCLHPKCRWGQIETKPRLVRIAGNPPEHDLILFDVTERLGLHV